MTTVPDPTGLEAQGVGANVTFDGATVTITRKGLSGAITGGRGEKHLPINEIAVIALKPASRLVDGYIKLDSETVVFRKVHQAAFEALHAAMQAAIPHRDTPHLIVAKGLHGASIAFDGQTVTIIRKGFNAAVVGPGTGEKRIPVSVISAVQYKKAGLTGGYIQFSFSGESARRSGSMGDRAKDENTVEFHAGQEAEFAALRDAIEAARAQAHTPAPPAAAAGPTVAERIQQLAGLHEQGLITDAEFEAKRTDLLAQL